LEKALTLSLKLEPLTAPISALMVFVLICKFNLQRGKRQLQGRTHSPFPKIAPGLYLYERTGVYYARLKIHGKQLTRSLRTKDRSLAKRLLIQLKAEQQQLDPGTLDQSLAALCDRYRSKFAHQAKRTREIKELVIRRICQWWPTGRYIPLGRVKASDCDDWLATVQRRVPNFGRSARNGHIAVLKDLFVSAVRDRLIISSPAEHLHGVKRERPIRLTPTFEQFEAIIASVRAQQYNGHGAEESADFLEFLGLAGLGQAEIKALTRADVSFEAGQIRTFRHKTSTGFAVPIYPQLRPLLEKLCKRKKSGDKIFKIADAKKALAGACVRLGYPPFSQRSLRRMFITRAIERGVDVKVIAEWQGHRDGGKLILDTYSHVRAAHSQRMAQLMTTEQPDNVVTLQKGAA
jgi:integrase